MVKSKLTALEVRNPKKRVLSDGQGLYLRSSKDFKRKQFVYRFSRPDGTGVTEMGLGPSPEVSLAEAREKRDEARKLVDAGKNPIKHRASQPDDGLPTFARAADELLESKSKSKSKSKPWSARHKAQWRRALTVLAADLRPMPIEAVKTEHVLEVLKPVWLKTPSTASRLRSRIAAVLAYGEALEWRTGLNPARWKDHLDKLLPKTTEVVHHKAMPYDDVPAFIARLHQQQVMSALALEFAILTAARSCEVLQATWSEVDLSDRTWTVPAARMKMDREHKVPLCDRAVVILQQVGELGSGEYIFPGRRDRPLSTMAFKRLLVRMSVDATTHGFRSSFRDWVAETTNHSGEVAEMALAHAIPSAVEKAYRRGNLFAKRRALMDDWAVYLG